MRLIMLVAAFGLAALGVRAQVLFPNTIDFGDMTVGKLYTQTLTFINPRTTTIYPIWGICSGTGEYVDLSVLPDSIAAGDTAEVEVKIRPRMLYPVDMGCGIWNDKDKPGKTWSVGYRILGTIRYAPKISFTEKSVAFGDVAVGDTAVKTITVTNSGDGVGSIHQQLFQSEHFTISTDSTDLEIDANGTVTLSVWFHPTEEGAVLDTVKYEASDQWWYPVSVVLSGTATPPKPQVSLSVDSVTFDNVPINKPTSAAVEMRISSSELTVTRIFPRSGSVFTAVPTNVSVFLPYMITPGDPLTFDVVATPMTSGIWRDTIVIQSSSMEDLLLPVAATAVVSHVDETTDQCLPHPNPSEGSFQWCATPRSLWIITDQHGRIVQKLNADAEGMCSAIGVASGLYVVRSPDTDTQFRIVVLR